MNKIRKLVKQKDCIVYTLDESHFSTESYLVKGWFKKRMIFQFLNVPIVKKP